MIIFLSLCCLIISCEKEEGNEIVINDLTEELEKDIHFDVYNCYNADFDTIYKTIDEFKGDNCANRNLPVSFGFKGILMLQAIEVPYIKVNGSAYHQEANIRVNHELKKIFFDYKLTTKDTSIRSTRAIKSSLVLLDGYDSTYQVIFNHEIIPLQE